MSSNSSPGPHRLKDVLDSVGKRMGLGKAAETGTVWARWDEIVGPANARHCEPSSLRRGVLRVRASSPTWATELGYLSSAIKDRANELAGAAVVTEVRIWTGPGPVRTERRLDPPSAAQPRQIAGTSAARDPAAALERAKGAWRKSRRVGS